VKTKVTKKGGRCSACRGRYEVGDTVTIVKTKRRVYHSATCVPANAGQVPVAGGAAVIANTPDAVVKALSSRWTVGEAKMVAILALENSLVVVAQNRPGGITPEMEKSFDRYNKLKGMAMRPGSDNEGNMAVRLAILEVVKTVF